MDLAIGTKYKVFFYEGNLNNRIITILAVFDDEFVAYKYFARDWIYEIDHISLFDMLSTQGMITKED